MARVVREFRPTEAIEGECAHFVWSDHSELCPSASFEQHAVPKRLRVNDPRAR